MSNNLTRKGLAVSSGLAIALTSLVGVAPATAAAGDIDIAPTSGNTWAVFNSDEFELTTDISVSAYVDNFGAFFEGGDVPLAYQLTNSDDQAFQLDLPIYADTNDNYDKYLEVIAYDARGIKVYDSSAADPSFLIVNYEDNGLDADSWDVIDPVIDFDELGATRVHIWTEDEDVIDTSGVLGPEWVLGVTPVAYDSVDEDYEPVGYGDGDHSLGIKSWMEIVFTENYATVESAYASATETINFYDPATVSATPRIERFVSGYYDIDEDEDQYTYHFNHDYADGSGDITDYVSFSVGFSKDVNLDQVDLSAWSYALLANGEDISSSVVDDEIVYDTLGEDYVYLSGTVSEDSGSLDEADRLYVETDEYGYAEDSYRVTIQYGSDTDNRKFTSGGFQQPLGSADADDIEYTASEVTNQNQEDSEDSSFAVRSGTKSITYSLQLTDEDEALKDAGVPVVMVLWSGYSTYVGEDWTWVDYLAEDATISVTGANLTLTTGNAAIVASGLTDANGKVNFTVTHSSATATEGYNFELYYANEFGEFEYATDGDVVYENTAVSAVEADSNLIAGSKVDLTFTVTDQFGQPISKRGTTALNLDLTSSNGEDLDLSAAVAANGEAKFSFNNYLAIGETDVLTAQVLAGTTELGGVSTTVDLYNSPAAGSVTAATSVETVVSYADYITGTASATNVAPDNADGVVVTGTVLDASGAGIAGAVATVSGTGLQFRKADSGAYAKDTITVVADTNGQFSVRVWAQKVSATGHVVTLTSGGKTATTKVITHLPDDLGGDNLSFSFSNLPSVYVKNTTYAVSAKLTDKWGNPVSTLNSEVEGVTFTGTGSVEINSSDEAVDKNFNKDGIATVYLRSVKDVAGPGSFTARLNAADYTGWNGEDSVPVALSDLGVNTTNNPATAWDETKWTRELEQDVEVLNVAPASGKVNVGSFNGKLVVYASGLAGKTISWKVGGNWGKAVATSDFARFDRPTPRRGVQVGVQIFVDGQPVLTKVVTTR